MKRTRLSFCLVGLVALGCAGQTTVTDRPDERPTVDESASAAPGAAASGSVPGVGEPSAAADQTNVIFLSPENTSIEFVGLHTGDDPRPRHGQFNDFRGQAVVEKDTLTSLSVEIQTASLETEIEKLTNHLKSPDFFDVRTHPTATFESTAIERADDGTVTITGGLTLLGNTQEISFPAKITLDDTMDLNAEFTVPRKEFGMTHGLDQIENEVQLMVSVGK